GLPFVTLSKLTIAQGVFSIIPERMARKYKVIAFAKENGVVKIAMTDPANSEIKEMISQKTSQKVEIYLATERDMSQSLQIYRKDLRQMIQKMLQVDPSGLISDIPIADIVDLLITYAHRDKASDIHIEPEEENLLIRFRIDSILHDVLNLSKDFHQRIVTRIKVLSNLPTDEHLSAQDGKMRMKVDDENLDIRVSIIPVADGEKVVLRLLSSKFRPFSFEELGMDKLDSKNVTDAINKSYGMVLSTGPTGSGKTTTIYSILRILNTRDKNITTIEDPIEYRIKGVNQIQLNTKTNLTFANGLRSILRQDPNIIFVGEIRDSETASIAVNAALTGHLVLSTLHTNDSATALPRLIDMKVESFLVAATVNIIIAQRLVRKICLACKHKIVLKREEIAKNIPLEIISAHFGNKKSVSVFKGMGCEICHFTGYIGRIGIFEVMEITERVRRLIIEKKDSDIIKKETISEGMTTMLDDGLQKVVSGITTIEEVLRVTKVES
ncbi:hypothetical protein A3D79_02100, partial [Candidatus Daviesbacteria bacterium RIFCSPHIGHO2_02_FULL_39_8]